jgi:hydroxypyruvate isomerase
MISRRDVIKSISGLAALGVMNESMANRMDKTSELLSNNAGNNINHSACRWCYNDIPLEDFCKTSKELGLVAIDLLEPEEWAMANKYGLQSSMGFSQPKGYGIMKGFNRIENHAILLPFYEDLIKKAANSGLERIICFSGNRDSLSDEKGIENCAIGLQKLMSLAEKNHITICMELLNSKVDHKDYMCDHTSWGVELCKKIGSSQFKLLYDIYHMQIMEGDVIRTIKDNHNYIGHYHTGGVPGRHEIDETQELFYPAIMKAIVETGYKGVVAQEFIPTNKDKIASLKKCVAICS